MKYFIKRDLNEYGPYTLADLQRYVAQGNILLSDLTRSEGMNDWVLVSQVMGNIPVPVPAAVGTVYSGAPGSPSYVSAYGVAQAPSPETPIPPDFHWALVLVINYFCGLFGFAWLIVEASFIKKIAPHSKAALMLWLSLAGVFIGVIMFAVGSDANEGNSQAALMSFGGLLAVAGIVTSIAAKFIMRNDLEEYYNTTENINLRLSGIGSTLLTLFFGVYYFQWHFSRIAKWKKTGVLMPQSG